MSPVKTLKKMMKNGNMPDAQKLQARLHFNQQHVNDLVGEKQQSSDTNQ